jgi:hypothetical protein
MEDRMARGGVRRYLDSVTPAEYLPDVGEVNLQELVYVICMAVTRGLYDLTPFLVPRISS